MRSPAAAIAWEFRRQHRWGWIAIVAYLVLVVPLSAKSFSFGVVAPLVVTFTYFLAVFTFGFDGDLADRQSIYPSRMFTLPVSTSALAAWPMLYGSAAIAILWCAARLLAKWPERVAVPIIWPAMLAASLLAWTQALTWMPYAMRGLRVVVTIVWLVLIDTTVIIALEYRMPEPVMLAILVPHLPLAYVTARYAVARARRGDVPDWRVRDVRAARFLDPFSSPTHAQEWLEWRQFGWTLPLLVGSVLPLELALLFVFRSTPSIVYEIVVSALLLPPLMAPFVAATVRKSDSSFATRPLTSTAFIAAKWKTAMRSTLVVWSFVAVAIPVALRLSGTLPLVVDRVRALIDFFGLPRAIAIVLLGFVFLVTSTWKLLVQSLYVGMSGRAWLAKSSAFVPPSLLVVAGTLLQNRGVLTALWNAFPVILAVFVCAKTFAAGWTVARLHDGRLLGDRALLASVAGWNITVFALFGVFAWIVPGLLIRGYGLAFVAILAVPFVRLAAAPLALAWNRHR